MKFTAPGKLVAWGEYAVLAGAPAVVFAVNRHCSVELTPAQETWAFSARGFLTPGLHTRNPALTHTPVAGLVNAVLRHWRYDTYPGPFQLMSDSRAFYDGGSKLGIGSSAAVCVATYAALAELCAKQPEVSEAIEIHRAFQGGRGSGLDIATSWHGGAVAFTEGRPEPFSLPPELHWQVVWTGSASETARHLDRFEQWRRHNPTPQLDDLCAAATHLGRTVEHASLTAYTHALKQLDAAAGLNIYTNAHNELDTIGYDYGVVYKPCGAGGGDIGTAFSNDPERLAAFNRAVLERGFKLLDLEISDHGVRRVD